MVSATARAEAASPSPRRRRGAEPARPAGIGEGVMNGAASGTASDVVERTIATILTAKTLRVETGEDRTRSRSTRA